MNFEARNCWIKDNTIRIGNLTNQRLASEFIFSVRRLHLKFKHEKIVLDFKEVDRIYPSPTTAIAGYCDFFRNHMGIDFEFVNVPGYLRKIDFIKPKIVSELPPKGIVSYLDHIWRFTCSEDVFQLVEGILTSLRRTIECEPGVIDAITWGLNETMDNVIQHSESDCGYVSAAVHKQSKCISICVYDSGIGILRSLQKSSIYRPRNAVDAISLAVKEGVTRDKSIGQGNGMWGLYNLVNLNSGKMSILSGRGGLSLSDKIANSFRENILLDKLNQSTTVSFLLDLSKDISIKDALGGHELVDLYLEDMEDEYERIIFKVAQASTGTGTRQSGNLLRNEVVNIIKKTKKPVIIDFDGVGIISSSFADEFIGKLVAEVGFFQFQKIFTLENMNLTVQAISQRSISLRISE